MTITCFIVHVGCPSLSTNNQYLAYDMMLVSIQSYWRPIDRGTLSLVLSLALVGIWLASYLIVLY